MKQYKDATNMTEQEAKEYCKEAVMEHPNLANDLQWELNQGSTYRQIVRVIDRRINNAN